METLLGRHWHYLPADEVLDLLESDREKGLDSFEVEHRKKHFGPNVITGKKGKRPLLRFILQFHQPLIYILIVAGTVTAFLQEWVDAGVIFGVVVINAIIGYLQEAKAVTAIDALSRSMTAEATVVRDGRRMRLSASELVPGDVVVLQAGDKIPADMRLTYSRDLRIDESTLTGESVPVEKQTQHLPDETPLADRTNMTYATTLATGGQGAGVVVTTGDATEVGRISHLIAEAHELNQRLNDNVVAMRPPKEFEGFE